MATQEPSLILTQMQIDSIENISEMEVYKHLLPILKELKSDKNQTVDCRNNFFTPVFTLVNTAVERETCTGILKPEFSLSKNNFIFSTIVNGGDFIIQVNLFTKEIEEKKYRLTKASHIQKNLEYLGLHHSNTSDEFEYKPKFNKDKAPNAILIIKFIRSFNSNVFTTENTTLELI